MALDLIVQHVHSQLEKVSRGEEEKGSAHRGRDVAVHRCVLLEHLGRVLTSPLSSQKALAWCLGEQICEAGTGEEGGEPPGLFSWLCWPVSD